ncbi:MAG: D-glycero-beta-D-manno-heptose 1-phosphate adenylyltransferase, partial [Alphaproteobacteria bacterium]|nr:D-glycero-beta-D-manno-heptose 1-phosphate adenylyltransferase [Alphaproteobacteria bacterium]
LLRTDHETAEPVSPAIAEDLQRAAVDAIEGHQAVVLSDYGKGALSTTLIEAVITRARELAVPVVVDPKGDDFARYRGASVISPNRNELAVAARRVVGDDNEVVAAARALLADCGIDSVLATRGSQGMSLVSGDKAVHLPARSQDVFDVSGAGDTVVATFAAAVACGLPAEEAASLANIAAGIVVGKVGTAVVTAGDLEAALRHGDMLDSESKILAADRADERLARWRRQGKRIGFTNGCFDLLHPGHVSLMRQARAACDRLVVGLNSDASVARLKGPDRPVQGEAARALVLASLEDVDLVVVFGEDTPLALIERFRPDVLVKGADYALDEVVGGDLVRGWGGRVVLANLEPGHSTSRSIERLARGA